MKKMILEASLPEYSGKIKGYEIYGLDIDLGMTCFVHFVKDKNGNWTWELGCPDCGAMD